jgi:hypothetical protein
MQSIFDRIDQGNYTSVTTIINVTDTFYSALSALNTEVNVNTTYLKFMQALYPESHFELDTTYKYSPVKVVQNNVTVALIMPLHD